MCYFLIWFCPVFSEQLELFEIFIFRLVYSGGSVENTAVESSSISPDVSMGSWVVPPGVCRQQHMLHEGAVLAESANQPWRPTPTHTKNYS